MLIPLNDTIIIIGRIGWIRINEDHILEDGSLDLEAMKTVGLSGLYSYYEGKKIENLPYQKIR